MDRLAERATREARQLYSIAARLIDLHELLSNPHVHAALGHPTGNIPLAIAETFGLAERNYTRAGSPSLPERDTCIERASTTGITLYGG